MPCGVCTTSGWNCTAYKPRPRCSNAAAGVSGVDAVTVKPSGACVIVSKWLIHTCWSAGMSTPNRTARVDDAQLGAAVLAPAGLRDLAAEIAGEELRAVADAEHGDAGVVDAGVDRWRARRRGPMPARR